mgnify:CR=1 FL=1
MTPQRSNDFFGMNYLTWPSNTGGGASEGTSSNNNAASNVNMNMMMQNMARRNSMQPLPFMDFSFFPVREDPLSSGNATDASKMTTATNAMHSLAVENLTTAASDNSAMPHMTPIVSPGGHGHNDVNAQLFDNNFRLFQQQHQPAPPMAFHSFDLEDFAPAIDIQVHVQAQRSEPPPTAVSDPNSSPAAAVSLDSSDHSVAMSSSSNDDNQRFKPFHEEKWSHRYKELLEFHRSFGHAAVPHTYPKNPQLARWVKRQRRQFKLRKEGKPSTMTPERLELLDSVGFIWDSHDLNWREKLEALTAFKAENSHCNVPSNFRDKKLATWVKCQRRQYKLYWDGKPSAMSPFRISALERLGFEWEIRSAGAKASSSSVPPGASRGPGPARSTATEDDPLPVHSLAANMGNGDHFLHFNSLSEL